MKFLFTTQVSNDLGLLTRSLPIACELKQRGHQVAFCNPAAAPTKLIAEAGLANLCPRHPTYYLNQLFFNSQLDLRALYRLLRSEQVRQDFGGALAFLRQLIQTRPKFGAIPAEIWSVDHLTTLTGLLSENFVRSECAALVQLMIEYAADVVVDSWHPVACLAARVAHLPLITILQADMHPANRGFIWWKEPPAALPTPTPILNKILAEHSLDPIRKVEELFAGDLTLMLGIPETDPLPPQINATYIGPILWQKPAAAPPDWFAQLDPDRPVIWAYSGNPRYLPISTPMDSSIVIRSCLAALAQEDVQVVLTTGHHPLPKEALPLPANFRHEPYVPGLIMAQRSQLLIHHGGYGSCQTGLYAGTPAVIIPTYSERESNARRLCAVGAAEYLVPTVTSSGRKKQVSPDELRAKAKHVLATPSYAENTRRLSAKLQARGGVTYAADLIEDFSRGLRVSSH
ncbi:MAG TPA: nucleotide disphospho-sugar-binding domain-containing protein [Anaerolineae bacterium]|nr:nucleotide disphospho-sugar-binding domain-containing protein [Anaerolineae bacterium]